MRLILPHYPQIEKKASIPARQNLPQPEPSSPPALLRSRKKGTISTKNGTLEVSPSNSMDFPVHLGRA
jgi:hypothetical protein